MLFHHRSIIGMMKNSTPEVGEGEKHPQTQIPPPKNTFGLISCL